MQWLLLSFLVIATIVELNLPQDVILLFMLLFFFFLCFMVQVELLKLKASHSHLEAVVKLVADQEVTIEATSNNEEAPANSTRPALKGKTATGAAAASSSALALKGNNNSSSSGNSEPLVLRPLGILAAADENPAAAQALLRSLHGLALGTHLSIEDLVSKVLNPMDTNPLFPFLELHLTSI
jgi:hypothetical protein